MKLIIILAVAGSCSAAPYPTDCRNQTWTIDGGKLEIMSYHIHYNTVSSDQERFYEGFIKQFQQYFSPTRFPGASAHQCPFGPNFGYWADHPDLICSLEGPYQEHSVGVTEGGSPWDGPQRAFFIPAKYIDEAWAWSQANKGELDVLKHPNTGCMHDDHSVRAKWNTTLRDKCDLRNSGCQQSCAQLTKKYPCAQYYAPGKKYAGWCDKTCGYAASAPSISILNFPCNMPGTGCNDTNYPGPPACGCSAKLPLPDDAPEDSCKGCRRQLPEIF